MTVLHFRIFLLFFLSFSSVHCVIGQSPILVNFTSEDGLASRRIYQTFQDKEGLIWFATEYGVSRYDGHQFTNFRIEDGLADNTVLGFTEDYLGRLWFHSNNGKLAYYQKGEFFNGAQLPWLDSLSMEHYIGGIHIDSQEGIWVQSTFATLGNRAADGTIQKWSLDRTFGNVFLLYEDSSPGIKGIRYRGRLKQNKSGLEETDSWVEKDYLNGRFAYTGKNEALFATSLNKLISFNWVQEEKPDMSGGIQFESPIISVANSHDQGTWIGTLDGVFYASDSIEMGLLEAHSVTSSLEDFEGNTWFSTLQNGAYMLPAIQFYKMFDREPVFNESITTIFIDSQNAIWVGTLNNSIAQVKNGKITQQRNLPQGSKESLIKHFVEHKGEMLVFGNQRIHLIEQPILQSYPISCPKGVWVEGDTFYVASTSRFLLYTAEELLNSHSQYDESFNLASSENLLKFTILKERCTSVTSGGGDSIWVGTTSGLSLLVNGIPQPPATVYDTVTATVSKLLTHGSSTLLVGTLGQGLFIFENGSLKNHLSSPMLLENNITDLLFDPFGNLWVATTNGLNLIIDQDPKQIQSFNINNGLITNEINCLGLVGDTLLIGTTEGLIWTDIQSINEWLLPPRLRIEHILVDEQPAEVFEKIIRKAPNRIEVKLAGISFRNKNKIVFRYRRVDQGQSGDWIHTAGNELVLLTPDPGDFKIEIQASNKLGVWGESRFVDFEIQADRSWKWGAGLVMALLLLGIFLILRPKKPESTVDEEFEITVKVEGKFVIFPSSDLLFAKAAKDYVEIFTLDKKLLVRSTLKKLEEEWAEIPHIMRVHRSYLVNFDRIDSFDSKSVRVADTEIPMSKSYKEVLQRLKEKGKDRTAPA